MCIFTARWEVHSSLHNIHLFCTSSYLHTLTLAGSNKDPNERVRTIKRCTDGWTDRQTDRQTMGRTGEQTHSAAFTPTKAVRRTSLYSLVHAGKCFDWKDVQRNVVRAWI